MDKNMSPLDMGRRAGVKGCKVNPGEDEHLSMWAIGKTEKQISAGIEQWMMGFKEGMMASCLVKKLSCGMSMC